jgi:large subunit ribosomal protein L22
MQATARIRYLKISPRKMRLVADLIKGKPVEDALNILNFTPRIAAFHLAKTVKAAAANAIAGVGTGKLKAEDLSISSIMVDQAPTAKRVRFESMGRVHRIRKRYCHLTVVVEGEPEKEAPKRTRTRKPKAKKVAEEAGEEPEETEIKESGAKKTGIRKKTARKTGAKAKKTKTTKAKADKKPKGKKPDKEKEGTETEDASGKKKKEKE